MTTVNQILSATPALEKLVSTEVPLRAAVILSKTQKELSEILKIYEEKRISLLDKLGVKGETEYSFEEGNQERFAEALNKLLTEELVTDLTPITLEILGDDVKLSAADVSALDFLLEIE